MSTCQEIITLKGNYITDFENVYHEMVLDIRDKKTGNF